MSIRTDCWAHAGTFDGVGSRLDDVHPSDHVSVISDHPEKVGVVLYAVPDPDPEGAFPGHDGPILCTCGDVLADRIDGMNVVIDGAELQFRRWSDEMTCRTCGAVHTMGALRSLTEPPVDAGHRRRRSDGAG